MRPSRTCKNLQINNSNCDFTYSRNWELLLFKNRLFFYRTKLDIYWSFSMSHKKISIPFGDILLSVMNLTLLRQKKFSPKVWQQVINLGESFDKTAIWKRLPIVIQAEVRELSIHGEYIENSLHEYKPISCM